MEPAELLARDPNTLPYSITEARTGRKVSVQFELLTSEDEAELRGAEWAQARFADVWRALVGEQRTFKLVCHRSRDRRIQGLVHIGHIPAAGMALMGSLLEAAPWNQYERGAARVYQGVGKQLVLRLVVESYRGGSGGMVRSPAKRMADPLVAMVATLWEVK